MMTSRCDFPLRTSAPSREPEIVTRRHGDAENISRVYRQSPLLGVLCASARTRFSLRAEAQRSQRMDAQELLGITLERSVE
jgi:hypothetical protein